MTTRYLELICLYLYEKHVVARVGNVLIVHPNLYILAYSPTFDGCVCLKATTFYYICQRMH